MWVFAGPRRGRGGQAGKWIPKNGLPGGRSRNGSREGGEELERWERLPGQAAATQQGDKLTHLRVHMLDENMIITGIYRYPYPFLSIKNI